MKSKFNNYIFAALFLSAVFLASCSSTTKLLYTSIDVLQPADVAFPKDVNRFLIVNNSITQPEITGHTTDLLDDRTPRTVAVKTDSLPMFVLSALYEELEDKGFFVETSLIYNSLNAEKDFNKLSSLPADKVKLLAERKNADAVLSLNRLLTTDALVENYDTYNNVYVLSLDVVYDSWWLVQYPDSSRQPKLLHYQDTVYWEANNASHKTLLNGFPVRQDALIDGALYVGQKMLNRLVPHWVEVDRYLFELSTPLVKQGFDSIYAKKWAAAIPLWETELSVTTKKQQQAQIQHNLAVVSEITGNLDKALEYITQAAENYASLTFPNARDYNVILDYRDTLVERYKKNVLIKEQLGE